MNCEFWEKDPHMSSGHDSRCGWRASPGVITFAVGCASHSASSDKVLDELEKFCDELIADVESKSERFPHTGTLRTMQIRIIKSKVAELRQQTKVHP
jgi:hypothetical protein